jgi:hypothetical protein
VAPAPAVPVAPAQPPPEPAPVEPPAAPATPAESNPAPPATPPAPLAPSPLLESPPKIDLSMPPPPAPVARQYRQHDGFYLRTSVGVVVAGSNVSTDRSGHPNYDVTGGGLELDLMIGGTPSPGLATGGAISLQGFGHGGESGTAGLGMLGVFVDGFPLANGGVHLGGMIGVAGGSTSRKDNLDDFDGGGLGLSAWLGHGFWIGSEWSMGGMLRFNGALLRDDSDDGDDADDVALQNSTYSLGLLFSVLYH